MRLDEQMLLAVIDHAQRGQPENSGHARFPCAPFCVGSHRMLAHVAVNLGAFKVIAVMIYLVVVA
jgi:hypothetical protein